MATRAQRGTSGNAAFRAAARDDEGNHGCGILILSVLAETGRGPAEPVRGAGPAIQNFHTKENPGTMTYIIAEPCIGTKDTACVDACPVDCIHPRADEEDFDEEEMLYIDPEECIDCGACVPVCPVSAIFAEEDLPDEWIDFTERNAEYYEAY